MNELFVTVLPVLLGIILTSWFLSVVFVIADMLVWQLSKSVMPHWLIADTFRWAMLISIGIALAATFITIGFFIVWFCALVASGEVWR